MDLTIFTNNSTEWALVLGGLIFLSYSTWVIKNEKHSYDDFGVIEVIDPFQIKVPSWWTKLKAPPVEYFKNIPAKKELSFKRTDTRYDWYSHFITLDNSESVETIFDNFLSKNLDIIPDPENKKYKTFIKIKPNKTLPATRIESMGTQSQTERIYIDLVVSKLNDQTVFIGYSLSSVLNGAVEGPYFDEVLKNISLS